MRYSVGLIFGVSLPFFGCVTSLDHEEPFSQAWADRYWRDEELRERRERVYSGEIVLVGREGHTRAALVVDERGKAKLDLGKRDGLSADVKLDTNEAEAWVKYKWGWKGKAERVNPRMPQSPLFAKHNKPAQRMETADRR